MKVKVIGGAFIITSGIKAKEFERLTKYNPTATKLKDDKGNVLFMVGYCANGDGVINKNGVIFNEVSTDGYLQLTGTFERPVDMGKRYDIVKDMYVPCVDNLNAAEKQIKDELTKLKDIEDRADRDITIE